MLFGLEAEKQNNYIRDLENKNKEVSLKLMDSKKHFGEAQNELSRLEEEANEAKEEKEELMSMFKSLNQESMDLRRENAELKKVISHSLEKEEVERKMREDFEKRKLEILNSRQMEMKKFAELFHGILPGESTPSRNSSQVSLPEQKKQVAQGPARPETSNSETKRTRGEGWSKAKPLSGEAETRRDSEMYQWVKEKEEYGKRRESFEGQKEERKIQEHETSIKKGSKPNPNQMPLMSKETQKEKKQIP